MICIFRISWFGFHNGLINSLRFLIEIDWEEFIVHQFNSQHDQTHHTLVPIKHQ
jgi:hypothetical protein